MNSVTLRCCIAAVVLSTPARAGTDDVLAARDTIERLANLEELCTRDPGHADCSPERRESACASDRTAMRPARGSDRESAETFDSRLVRYVAGVMVDAACVAPEARGTQDEDLEAVFRSALIERHADLTALAADVKDDLDDRASIVGRACSNARSEARWLEVVATAPDDAKFTGEGTIDREDVLLEGCRSLPDTTHLLIEIFAAFHDRFAGVPAASYTLARLEADTFNSLATAWDMLLLAEDCSEYVPVADSWRVGLRTVRPGDRLTTPLDPATRLVGAGTVGMDPGLAGSLDAMGDLLPRVTAQKHEEVCAALAERLVGRFAPAWTESLGVSREATYHFVNERAYQLELLREAYSAAVTLAETCGAGVDPAPWRADYLRHVVALVELLEPPLAATLSHYLGSRFDVDMSRS